MKTDRDTAVNAALTQSFVANHLENVNLKLNQSSQNTEAQVCSLVQIVKKLQVENSEKDAKIQCLEKRLKECYCQKSSTPGWRNTFNSNHACTKYLLSVSCTKVPHF